jgi:Domain of unknown function (DUF4157)
MNTLLKNNNATVKPAMLHGKAKPFVQPKLTVNTPGDIYEQEADAMADRVMRMSSNETAKPVTGLIGKSLQRKCTHCEDEEKKKPIMRKAEAGNSGMSVSSSFASSLNASKGGGSPLPQGTRSFMENAFSRDFSGVKIHTDGQASEMSKGINARAFTHGNDIYFDDGQYNTASVLGRHLLAHELTHTMQQGSEIGRQIQRAFIPGRCCNESETGADEWALVSKSDASIPTVWKRLKVGECVGNFYDTDCEGMTCGGGFYTVKGLVTLVAPGTCVTPGHDDYFYENNRWTPTGVLGSDALSPKDRSSKEGDTPPGYIYGQ